MLYKAIIGKMKDIIGEHSRVMSDEIILKILNNKRNEIMYYTDFDVSIKNITIPMMEGGKGILECENKKMFFNILVLANDFILITCLAGEYNERLYELLKPILKNDSTCKGMDYDNGLKFYNEWVTFLTSNKNSG